MEQGPDPVVEKLHKCIFEQYERQLAWNNCQVSKAKFNFIIGLWLYAARCALYTSPFPFSFPPIILLI